MRRRKAAGGGKPNPASEPASKPSQSADSAEQAVEQDWDGPDGAKQTPQHGFCRCPGTNRPRSRFGNPGLRRQRGRISCAGAAASVACRPDPYRAGRPARVGGAAYAGRAWRAASAGRATRNGRASSDSDGRPGRTTRLSCPGCPVGPREWTEPLWLPAAGERGEPRWLAAPAVLARLSQAEPQSAPQSSPQPAPEPTPLAAALPERRLSQAGVPTGAPTFVATSSPTCMAGTDSAGNTPATTCRHTWIAGTGSPGGALVRARPRAPKSRRPDTGLQCRDAHSDQGDDRGGTSPGA